MLLHHSRHSRESGNLDVNHVFLALRLRGGDEKTELVNGRGWTVLLRLRL